MASPQTGDGYTPIANELLEQVYKLKLNGTQFRIIMVVWRFTYGFSRKEHELSEAYISRAIDVHKKQVSRELNSLIDFNIVLAVRQATFTEPRVIRFNKNYNEWQLKDIQGTKQLPPNKIVNATGSGIVGSTGSGLVTQDKQNKTNINQSCLFFENEPSLTEQKKNHQEKKGAKIKKEIDIKLFDEFWKAYPRKDGKVYAKKAFDKLNPSNEVFEIMLIAIEKQKKLDQWKKIQFIPLPSSWLNGRRWEDEIEEETKQEEPTGTSGRYLRDNGDGTFTACTR